MVGSYSETQTLDTYVIVNADFPTPPTPTKTCLYRKYPFFLLQIIMYFNLLGYGLITGERIIL